MLKGFNSKSVNMGEKSDSESRMSELWHAIQFSVMIFGLGMLWVYFKCQRSGIESIPVRGVGQALTYVFIMFWGILICFTDVLFKRTEVWVRLSVFMTTLYGVGLYVFSSARINPLNSIMNFSLYTFFFLFASFTSLAFWYIYQTSVTRNYERELAVFQERHMNR